MGGKNYYFIEGTAEHDLIGFDSYAESLEKVINNGSKFIGLISDFGTGKSTLINMLKNRKRIDAEVVTINLWDCSETKKSSKKTSEEVSIHSVFLHQLISKLDLKPKNYYKKLINKNYRLFDIKLFNTCEFYIIWLAVFYILCFLDKIKFINLFPNEFMKFITVLLIALLTVLCIMIYKPLLSFDRNATTRTIDENDTKDLYEKIIDDYFAKNKDSSKKLVICLEELDRYSNYKKIIKYIEEFYKFYKLSDKNVIFIVALKSAASLCEEESEKEKMNDIKHVKDIYEKVFDFILNMNRVNVDDYDAILLDLLKEKEGTMPLYVDLPKLENMDFWRYLFYGKNTTIRDIKHRYNFAVNLYESILSSGMRDAKFSTCVYISYLEDEYSELYNKIIKDESLINSILLAYAKHKKIDSITDLGVEEKEVLLKALESKFIGIDSRYYFYKFPKNKQPYNVYELNLYNAIYFDEDNESINISINNLDNIRICEILKKRIESNFIPKVVFEYPKLIELSFRYEEEAFIATLQTRYDFVKNFENFCLLVEKLKKVDHEKFIIMMTTYFERSISETVDLTPEDRKVLRLKLVDLFKEDSIVLKGLFQNGHELITFDEMKSINDLETIYNVTDFDLINEDYINNLTKFTNKTNKKYLLKFLVAISNNEKIINEYYEKLFKSIRFSIYRFSELEVNRIFRVSKTKLSLNVLNNLEEFLLHIKMYSPSIDKHYVSILKSNDTQAIKQYIDICQARDYISVDGIDKIDECSTKFSLNNRMLEKLYERGHYYTYVASITKSKHYFEIEMDKFEILKSYYVEFYINSKNWPYPVDKEMLKFLHKNINVSTLTSNQLRPFIAEMQDINLIDAVIATDDHDFINEYFSEINSIKKNNCNAIYFKIGSYNKLYRLKPKARRNLRRLVRNDDQLLLLDARKFKKDITILS